MDRAGERWNGGSGGPDFSGGKISGDPICLRENEIAIYWLTGRAVNQCGVTGDRASWEAKSVGLEAGQLRARVRG